MNMGVSELLAISIPLFTVAFLVLARIVGELEPALRRKWLLVAGLGAGVIAFGLKLILIASFSTFPEPLFALWPERIREAARSPGVTRAVSANPAAYAWDALPDKAPQPADNPSTSEKVALGRTLFFDKRLSADGTLACATCHELSEEKGGADGRPQSRGIDGQIGSRNAPSVLNAAFQRAFFWDGRAPTLEDQARGPITNPIEMGMASDAAVEARLRSIDGYRRRFASVFGGDEPVTMENVTRAIAAFERTLITADSPYDRFVRGDVSALTERQVRGMALFESAGCVLCHSGPNFSEASLFGGSSVFRLFPANPGAAGLEQYALLEDKGAVTGSDSEAGLWRIPSLRNVARTAPYFHNGSVQTLEDAVRIMADAQLNLKLSDVPEDDRSLRWDPAKRRLIATDNQALSDREVGDIVAFLEALSGPIPDY